MEEQTKEQLRLLDGNFCIISNHKRAADLLHRGFGPEFVDILLLWEQLEQVLNIFFIPAIKISLVTFEDY